MVVPVVLLLYPVAHLLRHTVALSALLLALAPRVPVANYHFQRAGLLVKVVVAVRSGCLLEAVQSLTVALQCFGQEAATAVSVVHWIS